jgi:hypothetical protein
MHMHNEQEARKRAEAQENRLRAIVREEITQALRALDFAASDLDDYDTPELDSRAYSAGRQVAQRAVTRLQQCWTEGHAFKTIWDRPLDTCRRCGAPVPEPVNPFEPKQLDPGCKHDFAIEGEVTVCLLCEGVKTNGAS